MSKEGSAGQGAASGSTSELAHFRPPQTSKGSASGGAGGNAGSNPTVATSVLIDVMNTSSSSDASQATLTPSSQGHHAGSPSPSGPQMSSTPYQTSPESVAVTIPSTTNAPATTVAIAVTTQSGGGTLSFFKRYSGWGLSHSSSPSTTSSLPTSGIPSSKAAPTQDQPPPLPTVPELKIPMVSAANEDDKASQVTYTGDNGGSRRSSSGGEGSVASAHKANSSRNQSGGGGGGGGRRGRRHRPPQQAQRPCQTHSFNTDAAEVQQMEKGLLKLLDDFNSGRLRAFGQGCSMEHMETIRDQQESLAKLHFELGARQDIFTPLSEDGLRASAENMSLLMTRLEKLSVAIGDLNPAESSSPKKVNGEAEAGNSDHDGEDSGLTLKR